MEDIRLSASQLEVKVAREAMFEAKEAFDEAETYATVAREALKVHEARKVVDIRKTAADHCAKILKPICSYSEIGILSLEEEYKAAHATAVAFHKEWMRLEQGVQETCTKVSEKLDKLERAKANYFNKLAPWE